MEISRLVEEFMPYCAVRGHEEGYLQALGNWMEQFGQVERQRQYAACRMKGNWPKKKIMVLAYVSTPGFLAGEVKDNGYVKMIPIDGIGNRNPLLWIEPFVPVNAETYSKRVTIYGEKPINGIVPAAPVHYQTSVGKVAQADGVYAVTGYTKEELDTIIAPGDAITYTPYVQRVLNGSFFAPFLECRIAAAVLVSLAEKLSGLPREEEIVIAVTGGSSFSGAVDAVKKEKPDEIIVVSAATAASYKQKGIEDTQGLLQCFGSAVHYGYSEELEQYFHRQGYHHTRIASVVHTDTPADECGYLERGIPTAMFAVPVKYTRSSVSMVRAGSAKYLVDALADYLSGKEA